MGQQQQQHRRFRRSGYGNNTSDVFLSLFLREKVSIQHEKRFSSAHDCLTDVSLSLSLFSSFLLPPPSTRPPQTRGRAGSDDAKTTMTSSRPDGRRERRFIYGICTTR